MKICFFCGHFPPAIGGAEFATFHLANHLVKQGVEVVIQAGRRSDRKGLQYLYPVRNWRYIPLFSSEHSRQLHLMVEKFFYGFDIIHAVQSYEPGYYAAKIKKFIGTPLVITSQGADVQIVPEIGYGTRMQKDAAKKLKYTFERANAIVAVSKKNEIDLIAAGANPRNIKIIHSGCEFEKIQKILKRVDLNYVRKKYGLQADDFVTITVGRNSPIKGLNNLLDGIKAASTEIPNLKCILVGPKGQLENVVKELGLLDRVILIGRIPPENARPQEILTTPYSELIELYKSADVYVNASLAEAFPLTIMDALACGLPVVLTSTSGIVDLIKDGSEGFVYEPKEMDTFVRRLVTLSRNRDLRLSMGHRAKKQASEWDWSVVGRKHIAIYETILKNN